MYSENSIGPRIEPWGITHGRGADKENKVSKVDRKIPVRYIGPKPLQSNTFNTKNMFQPMIRILWSMGSNVAVRSKSIRMAESVTINRSLKTFKTFFVCYEF